jgi:hypothetical protein
LGVEAPATQQICPQIVARDGHAVHSTLNRDRFIQLSPWTCPRGEPTLVSTLGEIRGEVDFAKTSFILDYAEGKRDVVSAVFSSGRAV